MGSQTCKVLWCYHNPWIYLSLLFDGIVSVFAVSNDVKYDILL